MYSIDAVLFYAIAGPEPLSMVTVSTTQPIGRYNYFSGVLFYLSVNVVGKRTASDVPGGFRTRVPLSCCLKKGEI